MEEIETNKPLTKSDLSQFIGTENYYKGWLGVLYTDGVQYISLNGLSWLVTDICSYQVKSEVKNLDFQSWTLKVNTDKTAVLTLTDGNNNKLLEQKYSYTDCPIDEIKLYLIDNVLMLVSEY